MEFGGAVKVEYWAEREAMRVGVFDLEGIEDFREGLAQNYISKVHARPGPCGGLYGFTVEFLTSFSLQHFVNVLLDGVAYDLVKSGSKALVLRPFFAAYNALKARNADRRFRIHIEDVLLNFQDSVIVIHDLGRDTILANIQAILQALAANYCHLMLRTGEKPFSINIPIFEDVTDDRLCRFRELLDVDEPIRDPGDEHYLGLWGAQYDYAATTRVFDVKKQVLLDEEFYTRAQYWHAWEARRRRGAVG
jgi:hypothetical protein